MIRSLIARIKDLFASRHEPEAQSRIARRYWFFLLIVFFLIVVGSVSYGAWEFTRPFNVAEEGESVIVARPKAPLNQMELRTVLEGFDARVPLFEERQNAPSVPDPS